MVLPLPGALAQFSSEALKNISALDGITKSVPSPQDTVNANIVSAATASTTGPGSLFAPIPGYVDSANQAFVNGITQPPALSNSLQQSSLNAISGVGIPTTPQVDAFVGSNVRLEDVLPAQQIFNISKNLGNTSMYADPLQAYTHVAGGTTQIKSLCLEAESIIAKITQDIAELLSVQPLINYAQYAAMGPEFFLGAASRIGNTISAFNVLCSQLNTRGKFESSAVSAFCTAIQVFQDFVTFANVKIQQFELLRKEIQLGLARLSQILTEMIAALKAVNKFIPAYATSVAVGSLFRTLQKKVCDLANVDLQKILNDVEAFSQVKADDRAKVNANFSWASSLEPIKAFVCGMQPGVEVTNPIGEFAALSSAYNALTSSLSANDPSSAFGALINQLPLFAASMAAGAIKNNAVDLSASAASILATLAILTASLTVICTAVNGFNSTFAVQTGLNPARLVGALDLYDNIGADNAKKASIENAGDTTSLPVSESTSYGQLAESMKRQIDTMPDGNERDQLIILYEKVQGRHRATVLSMDFQRRQETSAIFAVDDAEEKRRLINESVKTYSGLSRSSFDQIFV